MPDTGEEQTRKIRSRTFVLKIGEADNVDDIDDALDSLAEELAEARESLRTERFLFFALMLIALDAYLLTWGVGWGMMAFVGLQIICMAILANYFDVPSAKAVFNKVLNRR